MPGVGSFGLSDPPETVRADRRSDRGEPGCGAEAFVGGLNDGAAVLGFLGFSYNQKGCVSYQQVISSRNVLVEANVEQVQGATEWIAWTVLAWGVVVVICLKALQKRSSRN